MMRLARRDWSLFILVGAGSLDCFYASPRRSDMVNGLVSPVYPHSRSATQKSGTTSRRHRSPNGLRPVGAGHLDAGDGSDLF